MADKVSFFRRWYGKLTIAAIAVVLLYTIAGFFVVPAVVKGVLTGSVSETIGRPITVEKIALNPYTLTVEVTNLAIAEAVADNNWSGFSRLHVDVSLASLFRLSPVVASVTLEQPYGSFAIAEDGSTSIDDILENLSGGDKEPAEESDGIPDFYLARLDVIDGRFTFSDRSEGKDFEQTLSGLTFSLGGLSADADSEGFFTYGVKMNDGAEISGSGILGLAPFSFSTSVGLKDLQLANFRGYTAAFSPAVYSGKLSTRLSVAGRFDEKLTIELMDNALSLRDFAVQAVNADEPLFSLASLHIAGVSFAYPENTFMVESVKLSGGRGQLALENDGTLNAMALLPTANSPSDAAETTTGESDVAPPEAQSAAAATGSPITGEIKSVVLDNFNITFDDNSLADPARTTISGLALKAGNITTDFDQAFPLSLRFDLNEEGGVAVSGELKPVARSGQFDVELTGIPLKAANPYVADLANVFIGQGRFDLAGTVGLEPVGGDGIRAVMAGNLVATEFNSNITGEDIPLVSYKDFRYDGIEFVFDTTQDPPYSLQASELYIEEPVFHIVIGQDKSVSLQRIAKSPAAPAEPTDIVTIEEPTPPAPEPGQATEPLSVDIGKYPLDLGAIRIEQANIIVEDRHLGEPVTITFEDLDVLISNLDLAGDSIPFNISGDVNGSAPLNISGSVSLPDVVSTINLKLTLSSLDLTAFSPYTVRYAGLPVEDGSMSFIADYKVRNSVHQGSTNDLSFRNLKFGERINNPDAPKLPVRLAVKLLTQPDGRIVIGTIPLEGRVDSPTANPSKAAGKIIRQTITKVAAAPLTVPTSMLGKFAGNLPLIGGGKKDVAEIDLSFLAFAPGKAAINESGEERLKGLAAVLTQRPLLSLAMVPAADPKIDRSALIDKKFRDQYLNGREPTEVDGSEYKTRVEEAFYQAFPEKRPTLTPEPATTAGSTEANAPAGTDAEVTTADPAPPQVPLEEMVTQLKGQLSVSDEDLDNLAKRRAKAVRDFLIGGGLVSAERVSTKSPEISGKNGSRVAFEVM